MGREQICIAAGCVGAIAVWIVAHILMGTHPGDVAQLLVEVLSRTFLGFVAGALLALVISEAVDRARR